MTRTKVYTMLCIIALFPVCSCATRPRIEKPQYTWQNYKFSVLLAPEMLNDSPKLDLGLSLMQIEYPAGEKEYFQEVMYGTATLDEYTRQIIREQRDIYRNMAPDLTQSTGGYSTEQNWSRSEKINIVRTEYHAMIVERDLTVYSGGDHPNKIKRYYVIDMEEFKLLKIDDLFAAFNEEIKIRDIVYEELRKYGNLAWGHPLSEGIYFTNEPEISFNFFITDEGLGLHWDPEQIAPYDEGAIEVILPWQIIRPLMLYTGIELLRKFNLSLFTYAPEELNGP